MTPTAPKGWLVMWLEPLGEDRWLRPDETFRVRSDYNGDEPAFSINFWVDDDDRSAGIENVAVWIENGDCYAEVVGSAGNLIECGHQRPAEVDRRWQAVREEAQGRAAERKAGGETVG
ncbi:hypothetical protein QF026_006181 [Streptomyces aurantiacus]|uniref:hypothetical protein n=1 Tax=Streptomyces aurantiacus TaxID=47760 RepID=UPI00278EA580|nr:hypothetical protein [Streptomyces aurantiacus]MDQ0777715.1 hypothetical protein [Streptomyces aurantiacus]